MTVTFQPTQTRAHQLERWLFSAMRGINNASGVRDIIIRDALSHCMGADNIAVARRAARELARLESKRMVR